MGVFFCKENQCKEIFIQILIDFFCSVKMAKNQAFFGILVSE